jgi:spore coat polysaccharide biosynthesis protein SpsF (cytidylyltransferase family)
VSSGVLAIVQARMSSSRLPGKTLATVGGEPMLGLLLKRVQRARLVSEIVVATSTDPADEAVAQFATAGGVGAARGPLDDVLARFLGVVGARSGPVVRITGDCPLIDPYVIDATVGRFTSTAGCSYASNIDPRTFPDGLDVEVISADALRTIAGDALSPLEREHVTVAIRSQPERFPAASVRNADDLGSLRWTVDDAEDLDFVRAVADRLEAERYTAGLEEILAAVRRPPSLARFGGARRG